MMKRVPNFYRRNAAAGAVRRVLDKKKEPIPRKRGRRWSRSCRCVWLWQQ